MTVEELLKSKQIPYIPKGKDFVVKCLNPEHNDRNPSMRIDQITGIFNCFSCEFKGSLFSFFGEKPNAMEIRRANLKKKIQEVRAASIGLSVPKTAQPYVGDWRNISSKTYELFGAFIDSAPQFTSRIVFPIHDITGRVVAFVGRHTGMGTPKYLNSPPGAKMPLFPHVTPIKGSVILVEGIFDMLNLHDKGLTNAMCCFGVKNVTEEKLSILSMQNVTNIDIFLDNDDAGKAGSDKIQGLCEKIGLTTRNIEFGNKHMDAGALSEAQVIKLKSKLYA